jgi:hypothetical protein
MQGNRAEESRLESRCNPTRLDFIWSGGGLKLSGGLAPRHGFDPGHERWEGGLPLGQSKAASEAPNQIEPPQPQTPTAVKVWETRLEPSHRHPAGSTATAPRHPAYRRPQTKPDTPRSTTRSCPQRRNSAIDPRPKPNPRHPAGTSHRHPAEAQSPKRRPVSQPRGHRPKTRNYRQRKCHRRSRISPRES